MSVFKVVKFFVFFLFAFSTGEHVEPTDMDFTLADFARVKRERRQLAVEFFDFYQNFTHASDTRITLPNVTLPDLADLRCLADLKQLSQALSAPELWALRFIDAWGTIPAGILYGNIHDLGNYDECVKINQQISSDHYIRGKYCSAQLPFGRLLGQSLLGISSINTAICLPASCSAQRMDMLLKKLISQFFNVNVGNSQPLVMERNCKTNDPVPYSGVAIATITILSILAALVVLSTLYDYLRVNADAELQPFVRSFSARANGRQLFRIVTKYNPNVVPCLHGMRCMSLIWVIYGHAYMLAVQSPNINLLNLINWVGSPYASFINQGVFAVDTFFFLSGLLVVMLALREMDNTKGKLNVPLMYLHRYLRLTPVLAVAIMLYSSLLQHIGPGPLKGKLQFETYTACHRNWWATLLYVQNYAVKRMCLQHSWYLAIDMQLYILSPIFLIVLWKWGKKAVAGIIVLTLLLAACLFSIVMIKHYSLFYKNGVPDSTQKIYFSTHTRASPWLVGLIFGYFMHKSKGKTFKLSKSMIWLGWLLALALIFTVIFALYPQSKWFATPLTTLQEAFYLTFARIAWPLALCWVVFACQFGYGGFANSFLSSPLWQPLSKLSYCIYIYHLFIINLNSGRTRTNTYFTDYDVMLKFWSDFGFSLLLATLMYLLIEAPCAGLESLALPNRRPTPKAKPAAEETRTQAIQEASGAESTVPASTTKAEEAVKSS